MASLRGANPKATAIEPTAHPISCGVPPSYDRRAGGGDQFRRVALRLNPHHPDWYLVFLSTALFTARRYPEAHALRSRAPEAFIDSPFFGAATLAHMGRLDEARRWADKALARLATTPGGALAIAEGRVVGLLLDNNPFFRQEDRDHFAQGMRKAGIPG
jgi:adenylate cyclase